MDTPELEADLTLNLDAIAEHLSEHYGESFTDLLERQAKEISKNFDLTTIDGRIANAAVYGYLDAKAMVFLMETHGMPLSLCAMQAIRHGLRIDYGGLRYHLECIGKKPETINSELDEVRYFVATAGGQ